ncbi:hypothetical protein MMC30_003091 [Trapelia coarctata]|nr:hypothetical protein [Trapelia coarctata]
MVLGIIALAMIIITVLGRVLSALQPPSFAGHRIAVTLALHFTKRRPSAPPVDTTKTPGDVVNTWVGGPVIATNFADPSFIEVNGVYYAFVTNRYMNPRDGQVNIQVAVSKDFSTWNLTGQDALPNVGPWSTGTFTWAPDVIQLDDGSFVMYYSSKHSNQTRRHCVGAATSKTIMGPYAPLPEPLAYPLAQGGAIDPDGFKDVDGNSLNNRTSSIINPTPLMLQQVNSKDGNTLVGAPTQLLDRGPEDGPLIEAPSMMRAADILGKNPVYILFYSSNVFTTAQYSINYATSKNGIKAPYTKAAAPLLQTGDNAGKLFGPGGLDVGVGGQKVVFHSGYDGGSIVHQMWTGQIAVNGTTVYI